ncbi:hypothetical protein QR680_000401 [Steinernema hermaphroditum]|uniref:Uncharacterized protein n=1 Tax=Steinernema hermaphroditum TaxID=289476 RepID=A0AA39LE39_9BILA|nr:hypothetical protein QR680_000401 [Steinernema hermaphroditum]
MRVIIDSSNRGRWPSQRGRGARGGRRGNGSRGGRGRFPPPRASYEAERRSHAEEPNAKRRNQVKRLADKLADREAEVAELRARLADAQTPRATGAEGSPGGADDAAEPRSGGTLKGAGDAKPPRSLKRANTAEAPAEEEPKKTKKTPRPE